MNEFNSSARYFPYSARAFTYALNGHHRMRCAFVVVARHLNGIELDSFETRARGQTQAACARTCGVYFIITATVARYLCARSTSRCCLTCVVSCVCVCVLACIFDDRAHNCDEFAQLLVVVGQQLLLTLRGRRGAGKRTNARAARIGDDSILYIQTAHAPPPSPSPLTGQINARAPEGRRRRRVVGLPLARDSKSIN